VIFTKYFSYTMTKVRLVYLQIKKKNNQKTKLKNAVNKPVFDSGHIFVANLHSL
jgi:hypothetical protein